MRRPVATVAGIAGTVVLPLLVVTGPPPASADLGDYCGLQGSPGLETFVWTGAAGDSLWTTAGNWEVGGAPAGHAPGLLEAESGYVCIDAVNDQDDDSDTVYLVHEDENLADGDSSASSAMLQALDLRSGTLSINRAGKLYLYGDPTTRPSFVRAGARVELTMGILGGSGRVELAGDLVMTAAQRGPATLKSSCRGIVADPPPGPDTLPEYCPPAADPVDGAGRLVVSGSLTIRGGVLDEDGELADDGLARGVNLHQRYGIVVADGGEVTVLDDAYLAQSHTASIEVRAGGSWVFDGDGDVVEGAFEGTPDGPLPPFVNDGTVSKVAGSGASSIDTAYAGGGTVRVAEGSLTTPGGFPVEVSVRPERALGTWDCPQVEFGTDAEDCAFDNPDDTAVTTEADLQAAQLRLPGKAAPDALVSVRESGSAGPEDLLPPIEVSSTGVPRTVRNHLDFEFNDKITDLPPKARVRIFRRAGPTSWQEVPRCKDDDRLPKGVTACVRAPRDRAGGTALVVHVIATDPVGEWVLRDARRTVVPRENGAIPQQTDGNPTRLDLPVATDDHCGPVSSPGWTFRRRLADRPTDDHAVGWWPTGTGRARGLEVPVGDLADLDAIAVRLRLVRGDLRGYVRVQRHESPSVSWVAVRPVVLADAEPAGAGGWLFVQAGSLDYRWQRHVDGSADGSEPFEGTIADLVSAHPDRTAAAPDDTVGFAFGCAGERVLLNEVVARSADESVPPAWDLEVPRARIRISKELQDIGAYCQLAHPSWPNKITRKVTAPKGAKWTMQWRPAGPGHSWRTLRKKPYVGPGTHQFRLPRQRGLLQAVLSPSDRHRRDGSGVIRFKAVPRIELRTISRSTRTRTLRVGHVVRLTGRSSPGGRVRLWTTGPTKSGQKKKLLPTKATDRVRNGRFTLTLKVTKPGRYGFAVEHRGSSTIDGAMSSKAFFTTIRPKPPKPLPQPAPAPSASVPPTSDQKPIDFPPPVTGRSADRRGPVPARCEFRVRS